MLFTDYLENMKKSKYDMKEILDIAESVVTILMFFMAVWGTIISYEEGFWRKLNHIVNHYHETISDIEQKTGHFGKIQKTAKHKMPEIHGRH
jgi:hypothetical protein